MNTHHTIRLATPLVTAASLLGLAGAPPVNARSATPAASAASGVGQVLTLVTGQRVRVGSGPSGQPTFTAMADAARLPLFTYHAGSTWYVIPGAVLHSVGSRLDPSLFDVAALRTAEAGTIGRMGVRVQWHGTEPSMPWLTHQRAVATGATDGVVTTASGGALETALTSGSLPGIDRIILLGATQPPPPPSPNFVQYTVTVNGFDETGAPDNGDTALFLNVDDARKGGGFAFWYQGVFKVSVPAGHYSLLGTFAHFGKASGVDGGDPPPAGDVRLAVVDFTVTRNTTVMVNAQSATALISATTPRSTDAGSGTVVWQRTSAAPTGGASSATTWSIGGGAGAFKVFVSPSPAPAVGAQALMTSFHLTSPSTSPIPYSYDLAYASSGAIGADQRHRAGPAQLATVVTRYYSDVPGRTTGEGRLAFFPGQFFGAGMLDVFTAPLRRTEYVLAVPGMLWSQQVIADLTLFGGFSQDSYRVFAPGEATDANWSRGPIGPGVAIDAGSIPGFDQQCPACLFSGALQFLIYPFGDNPPGHDGAPNFPGPGVTETDAYTLLRNGTAIASGQDPAGILVPVPSGPASYELEYHVALTAPWTALSTNTTTTWAFAAPATTGSPLPPGWICATGSASGCAVVALMFPNYQIPESLTGHAPPGPATFNLGITHILGVTLAATSAQVSVSFDGGRSWTPASTTRRGNDGFAVAYTNPSSGDVSLRIHVTDADGGVLDQTIINAYAIGWEETA